MKFSLYFNRRVFVMVRTAAIVDATRSCIETSHRAYKMYKREKMTLMPSLVPPRSAKTSVLSYQDFLCSLIDSHYENTPIQIYLNFYKKKKRENFQIKNSNIFHISSQNIDCGYSLEPPRRGGSNAYPQSMLLAK